MSAAEKLPALERIEGAGVSALRRPGGGRRIVFLHGIGGAAESFAGLLADWPAGPELIAWDAPGYGGSAALSLLWPSAEDYADRLAAFLDATGAAGIDLAGHSLGCLIAAAFAKRFPERVRKIALVAPAPGYGAAPGGALPEAVAGRVEDLKNLGAEKFAAARAARLVHDPAATPGALAEARRIMAQVNPGGYAQASRMLACGDIIKLAPEVRAPALVLAGAEDRITPPEGARRLAAVLSARKSAACEYTEIAGAGHALYLEKPRAALDALTRFFGSAA